MKILVKVITLERTPITVATNIIKILKTQDPFFLRFIPAPFYDQFVQDPFGNRNVTDPV